MTLGWPEASGDGHTNRAYRRENLVKRYEKLRLYGNRKWDLIYEKTKVEKGMEVDVDVLAAMR